MIPFLPTRRAAALPMVLFTLALILMPLTARAQNLFAPVATVNGRVITSYEVDQRARMLALFRAPGEPREEALKALIDERLQLAEAKRAGITVSAEEVLTGMEEFASRANLSREEFIKAIGQGGVESEAFRDFVSSGLAWRKLVRARFAGTVKLTEADIDKAVKRLGSTGGVRVLLSEIILAANTPEAAAAAERRAAELIRITTVAAFAEAARSFSVAPSRAKGGALEWLPIGNLPPEVAAQVLSLAPGQVTRPIQVTNAIALFQLRQLEEVATATPATQELDYAAFYIAGGRSAAGLAEAARVAAKVDTCDDLYGVAKGLPSGQLERVTLPVGQVPGDVALELAKLDENEVSTALTRANGQTLVFLMLCNRRAAPDAEKTVDREAVANQVINRRLAAQADVLLADLKANASITYP